ncbi:MAG: SAM-dependent methyltransferase [Chthonomonadales bacterium]
MNSAQESSSFRDPNGFIFRADGVVYRQIQASYQSDFELLISSGLYRKLADIGLLIPHSEAPVDMAITNDAWKVIHPVPIPFITYPYEWCFSQLKDAALLTLAIQKFAIEHGMSLKDASAYNIQYLRGQPIFIDTLSFEEFQPGQPWVAYRQFCQHFLAPLALMSHVDIRLSQLLKVHIDGIPLDLASSLLPFKTRLNFGLLTHVHLHGAAQKKYESTGLKKSEQKPHLPMNATLGLLDSLETTVKKLTWKPAGTEWADYYDATNYSNVAMQRKLELVEGMISQITPAPATVWDLGANRGVFSRTVANSERSVISWDIDPAAVEKNYLDCKADGASNLLPLIQDLTNPSPAIGWNLHERGSLIDRSPADALLALALIHHLCIGNNVPLIQVAKFFREIGNWLIIEFVPKVDSQVQRLLSSREDVFLHYTQANFDAAFSQYFEIVRAEPVPESERILYLMKGIG